MEEKKNLDIEMLIFFLCIAIVNFLFYLSKLPVISLFYDQKINFSALISIYLLDLIIFATVLLIYILFILGTIFFIIFKKIVVNDIVNIILFFPLFAFFAKGFFLPEVYININLIKILKINFAFFLFLFFGPILLIFRYFLKRLYHLFNS